MADLKCCFSNSTHLDPRLVSVKEVLASEFYRDCSQTLEFFAIEMVPSLRISAAVQVINKHFPVNSAFNFLKKIRNGTILIAPVLPQLESRLEALLIALGASGVLSDEMRISKIRVPEFPALTHSQFAASNAIWPVRVTTPLIDELREPDVIEKEKICNRLNFLIDHSSTSPGGRCMLLSPKNDLEVLGESHADKLSIKHAVFSACDQVGKLSDYLATGFKVFALGEPCVMCSMALLHSRVAEVYFVHLEHMADDKQFHGLGGTVSVHCNPQLNHRFRVFRVSPVESNR